MKSTLDYVRWARRQAPERGLTRGQAQMLQQLASHANERGECVASVQTLAAEMVVSERHAGRMLRELSRLGLQSTARRGRARTARRRLCIEAPAPPRDVQLSLFADEIPVVIAAPAAADDRTSAPLDRTPDVRQKEPLKETEEGTRAARAATPDPIVQSRPRVLQEHLDEVLEIVQAAPGLLIEPLAVDSALAAYPEASGHDHLRAAHTVASWAFEADGVRVGTANRLLMAALRKQTLPVRAAAGPRHDARRRREAPVMCDSVRRGSEVLERMLASKGIRV